MILFGDTFIQVLLHAESRGGFTCGGPSSRGELIERRVLCRFSQQEDDGVMIGYRTRFRRGRGAEIRNRNSVDRLTFRIILGTNTKTNMMDFPDLYTTKLLVIMNIVKASDLKNVLCTRLARWRHTRGAAVRSLVSSCWRPHAPLTRGFCARLAYIVFALQTV